MEEDNREYRWETGYEKTWEAITEDKDGHLEASVQEMIQRARRKRMMERTGKSVRLGMMRHLFVVLDLSECMNLQDLKPTRQRCALKLLEGFVEEFFYLNPISQMGLITTRNKRAEITAELAGNPRRHMESLRRLNEAVCAGEPSLQNSLEVAMQALRLMPAHASREMLVLMGSLTTCDPGDIEKSIDDCKKLNIRCSVISLSAEVRIYKELTKATGGDFGVILDDVHFRDLLQAQLEPPESSEASESSLIKMGFPCHSGQSQSDSHSGVGMCLCHLDPSASGSGNNSSGGGGGSSKLSISGFLCPQCHSKYCELPVECKICGLTLVSAPHLARSYHHLFPLPAFEETSLADVVKMSAPPFCFSCARPFTAASSQLIFKCPSCVHVVCSDCDLFIHETLHTCPGCASKHSYVGSNGNLT